MVLVASPTLTNVIKSPVKMEAFVKIGNRDLSANVNKASWVIYSLEFRFRGFFNRFLKTRCFQFSKTYVLGDVVSNECLSRPCGNNGECEDNANGFECKCYPGFEGDFCENLA